MHLKTVVLSSALASSIAVAAAGAPPVQLVAAPDSPVRLESLKVINADADPLVLLYAATNPSDMEIDTVTVMVFVFDADGRLKARQSAPARRGLAAHETKYSAMVLDVGKIEPTDTLLAGVDQVLRAGSEAWWRSDLRAIAEAAVDAQRAAKAKSSPRK